MTKRATPRARHATPPARTCALRRERRLELLAHRLLLREVRRHHKVDRHLAEVGIRRGQQLLQDVQVRLLAQEEQLRDVKIF
jgi:hypothetical protein